MMLPHNLPLQLELHTAFKILPMSSFIWESECDFRCRARLLLLCYIPQIWLLPLSRTCRVSAFVQPVLPDLCVLNGGSISSSDEASWLSHLFLSVTSSRSVPCRLPLFFHKVDSIHLVPSVLCFIAVWVSLQWPTPSVLLSRLSLSEVKFKMFNL